MNENSQTKDRSFLANRNKAFDFLREVQVELSKVVWPTRDQTVKLTIIVLITILIVGFFLGGLDLILNRMLNLLLGR